jgi:adenylate cyclase
MEFMRDNYEQAKALNLRAMQLNPTDAYVKAQGASIMTYLGDPEYGLTLVEEAESLDPLLPVWCVEERGVALYALGRYQDALDAFDRQVFQTARSRLYRAVSLVALDRPLEARKLCAEAVAGSPNLTLDGFLRKERFRDPEMRVRLRERLKTGGLLAS